MRYSQLLIPTVKEVPAEAEIASHRLMIRAGYIRKLASGTYTYLPLGWRSLLKIANIVRQEMNTAGAQEILMPIVQPMELWQRTGRDVVFQDILGQFTDRQGRANVLAPTAEEVVTALVAAEVSSYKQLPINLYQINTKFRDEFRPQYGVMRSREFMMKDAYSFDADAKGLNQSYRKMYDAYCRIFDRCGLKYVVVEADSGGMGGTDTEEFMVPLPVDPPTIEAVTTAAVGFAGPVGLADKVASMVIDHAVAAMAVGVTGANKTDYHTRNVVPGRDFPLEGDNVVIADVRNAVPGDTYHGKKLSFNRGIEIGHVFKLGTKYSRQLGCQFLDARGAEQPCLMGCYGIGINRILATAIEIGNDDNGCILPVSIAPFELLVLPINCDSDAVVAQAERIYNELLAAGVDVLLDDRPARPGVKFKDADLIGIPLRIAVGERGLADGKVEIKRRTQAKPTLVPAGDAVAAAQEALAELRGPLAPADG